MITCFPLTVSLSPAHSKSQHLPMLSCTHTQCYHWLVHDVADWQFPPAQVGKGTPVPDPQKTYLELSKKRKKSLKLFPRSEIKDSLERATPFKGKKTKENKASWDYRAFRQIAHDKIEEIRGDFSGCRNCTEPRLTLSLPGVTNL